MAANGSRMRVEYTRTHAIVKPTPDLYDGRPRGADAEHLRGCETRRSVDGDGFASPEPPASGRARNAAARAAGRESDGVRAEFRGEKPQDPAIRQAPRDGPRHLQPVLLADSSGDRGRGAARGAGGAVRGHAARRE